jgi:glycosyltransferase involved in cell wall biosynthesis
VVTTDHMVAGEHWEGPAEGWERRRAASSGVARSLADSGAIAECLVERVGLPADRVQVVHHGVDPDKFRAGDRRAARRALGLPPDRHILGAAGLLVSAKGMHTAVEACARLDGNPLLCILGDGPERPRLEAQARSLGAAVRFCGWRRDMPVWLRALDLLVHPSRTEGFSTVLLEAMASGCPVVATGVGGVPELLAGGRRGTLVPAGNRAALASALGEVLAEVEAWRRGSPAGAELAGRVERARRAVVASYSIQRTARLVAALYRRMTVRSQPA